jgi:hypothetical protein
MTIDVLLGPVITLQYASPTTCTFSKVVDNNYLSKVWGANDSLMSNLEALAAVFLQNFITSVEEISIQTYVQLPSIKL